MNRDFPTFSRLCIFFLLTLSLLPFFLLIFLFSVPLPCSAFHLSILSEVLTSKLPSIITYIVYTHTYIRNYTHIDLKPPSSRVLIWVVKLPSYQGVAGLSSEWTAYVKVLWRARRYSGLRSWGGWTHLWISAGWSIRRVHVTRRERGWTVPGRPRLLFLLWTVNLGPGRKYLFFWRVSKTRNGVLNSMLNQYQTFLCWTPKLSMFVGFLGWYSMFVGRIPTAHFCVSLGSGLWKWVYDGSWSFGILMEWNLFQRSLSININNIYILYIHCMYMFSFEEKDASWEWASG